MKKEVELKFRVQDFSPIRKKLKILGAKLIWKGREENWFFDTKTKLLRRQKILLRVRESDGAFLTLKESQRVERGMKVAHEYEVTVSSAKNLRSIFQHSGFIIYFHYSKNREHWKLPNAVIELDTLNPKKKYVEVEASREQIKKLAEALELDLAKGISKTYPELLRGKDVI